MPILRERVVGTRSESNQSKIGLSQRTFIDCNEVERSTDRGPTKRVRFWQQKAQVAIASLHKLF
ncbi:hypothetical protein WN51_01967 [Melipona quadrifasciata]|uniref:Uncharacterized protein n=1 Tax=Melipona quadrifasciata TaxID=166423 RepID=A0A0M9AD35_9HYME|nr:hypothetical protein WN51_01967 [Melipona quadrifasciata]